MRHTKATKRKLSALHSGAGNPFFGKKHTAEFKRRQSERTKAFNAKRQYDIGPVTLKPVLDDVTWAYIAGLLDGEGHIRRDQPTISIANTNRPLMLWLVKTLGGYVRYQKPKLARVPCGSWLIHGARNCAFIIDRTEKHLIIKREAAQAMRARLVAKYGDRLYG